VRLHIKDVLQILFGKSKWRLVLITKDEDGMGSSSSSSSPAAKT
jgi:hypothetical protein